MLKYILLSVVTISLLINIWIDIGAYKRKEYDPLIFRRRREYEGKAYLITQLGFIIPIAYFQRYFQESVYEVVFFGCLFGVWILTSHILNLLCYFRTKRKRILIELVISDLSLVLITIFIIALVSFEYSRYVINYTATWLTC